MKPKPKAKKPVKNIFVTSNCPHCKKRWDRHLGVHGTCFKLQIAIKALKKIEALKCDLTIKGETICPGCIAYAALQVLNPRKAIRK